MILRINCNNDFKQNFDKFEGNSWIGYPLDMMKGFDWKTLKKY